MQGTFWSHTIWYLLLAAVSIFVTVVIFIRSDNRKYAIGFGLAVMGLTFFSETGLLTLSNAYRYMPKNKRRPVSGFHYRQLLLAILNYNERIVDLNLAAAEDLVLYYCGSVLLGRNSVHPTWHLSASLVPY